MEIVLGWPQWIIIALWCISLISWGALHGRTPTWKYNIGTKIVDVFLCAVILYCGGFFTD